MQLEESFKGRLGLCRLRDYPILKAVERTELTQSPLEIVRSPAVLEYRRPATIKFYLRANKSSCEAVVKARLFAKPLLEERQVRRVRREAVQFQNVKRDTLCKMIENR